MEQTFTLTVSTYHPVTVAVPSIGDVAFPANGELQLYGASRSVVEFFRRLKGLGIEVNLNKVSKTAFLVYDYDKKGETQSKLEVEEKKDRTAEFRKMIDEGLSQPPVVEEVKEEVIEEPSEEDIFGGNEDVAEEVTATVVEEVPEEVIEEPKIEDAVEDKAEDKEVICEDISQYVINEEGKFKGKVLEDLTKSQLKTLLNKTKDAELKLAIEGFLKLV